MKARPVHARKPGRTPGWLASEGGFGIVEMLISSLLLVLIGGASLGLLADIERTAVRQADMQAALDGALFSLDMVQRLVRQSGNDPHRTGLEGLEIVAAGALRIRSDLTGNWPGEPDKGDPDGDAEDAYEDILIRNNTIADTLEVVTVGGGVQTVAEQMSGLSLEFWDHAASVPGPGAPVSRIRITVSAAGGGSDLQTHRRFGLQVSTDVVLETR